ncbi:hypothetical protein [Xanthomonas phage RTH11]|nr:hypothetical protein [Xanthomonas phage RTH11]
MARPADPTGVRPEQGRGGQPPIRRRPELSLVVNLNPESSINQREQTILHTFGVDGHWFFTFIVDVLIKGIVDPLAPRYLRDVQLSSVALYMEDQLHQRLLSCVEAEGYDDDRMTWFDAVATEEIPSLLGVAEKVLGEMLDVLSNMEAPAYCVHRRLDKYLMGYSTFGNHAGYLHFYFSENADNHSL